MTYVFKEYPKWVGGKIVKNAEEEADVRPGYREATPDETAAAAVALAETIPGKRKYTRKA